MANQYTYETDQFGISEKSIHLLRNCFNYQTIDCSQVQRLVIRKGMEHKNWILILSIGIALLTFVVIDSLTVYNYWNTARVIYIERLLIPLFPFLLGLYSVIISIRKSMVMIVHDEKKRYYFSLRQLTRKKQYEAFVNEIKGLFPLTRIEE
jgi:hypothetical protein